MFNNLITIGLITMVDEGTTSYNSPVIGLCHRAEEKTSWISSIQRCSGWYSVHLEKSKSHGWTNHKSTSCDCYCCDCFNMLWLFLCDHKSAQCCRILSWHWSFTMCTHPPSCITNYQLFAVGVAYGTASPMEVPGCPNCQVWQCSDGGYTQVETFTAW